MSDNGNSRPPNAFLSLGFLCLAALLNACGSDPQASSAPTPILGCETLDIAPCDTLQQACQQSRLELAACLRGTTAGRLPRVTVMTEQGYTDYVNATYEGTGIPLTNHFEATMTWLGLAQLGSFDFVPLVKEGVTDKLVSYRWRQKELLFIDHGKPAADDAANIELVASMIRWLRDQDTDIAAWTTEVSIFDVDSNWGGDAMYFGEARFYSNRYKAALAGVDPASVDELSQINADIRQDIDWIRAQPSTYVATNERFSHNFGARAAYLAWRRDGVEAVNALYHDKLLTQQLMASETEEGPAPALRFHARPRAPEEWASDPTVTALGAWGLFLSLSRFLETDAAWSLALGWSGEQLFVFKGAESAPDETALVWQLELADEVSASALEEALLGGIANAQVRRTGTFVTLAISSNDSPLDWAFVGD